MPVMIEIEAAKTTELAEIAAIEYGSFSHPWDEASLSPYFESNGHIILLARIDNITAGYILNTVIGNESELLRIAVLPQYRGRGVAGMLIESMIGECRKRAIASIFLEVNENNTSAWTLYFRKGFEKISVRRNYYPDGDALICKLDIL